MAAGESRGKKGDGSSMDTNNRKSLQGGNESLPWMVG